MGFFKDLREDISLAVNELLPDDSFWGLEGESEEQVAENEIDYKGEDLKITMTYGLISSESFDEMETAIKAADKLLYEGKERGRNCIIAELSEE